jgi:hypothetical protein
MGRRQVVCTAPFVPKLTPADIELYRAWDAALETFGEANYVACLPWLAERLPAIGRWKLRCSSGRRN